MRFTACRDIKAGSQIYASYTHVNQTKAEREASLAPYGIECTCRCCVNATPSTDKLRKISNTLIQNWKNQAINVWMKDPNLKESVLDPVLATKKRMEEEGMDEASTGYYELFEIIHMVYKKMGKKEKAEEWAAMMKDNAMGLILSEAWRKGVD